jgi:hypothetical protein
MNHFDLATEAIKLFIAASADWISSSTHVADLSTFC